MDRLYQNALLNSDEYEAFVSDFVDSVLSMDSRLIIDAMVVVEKNIHSYNNKGVRDFTFSQNLTCCSTIQLCGLTTPSPLSVVLTNDVSANVINDLCYFGKYCLGPLKEKELTLFGSVLVYLWAAVYYDLEDGHIGRDVSEDGDEGLV